MKEFKNKTEEQNKISLKRFNPDLYNANIVINEMNIVQVELLKMRNVLYISYNTRESLLFYCK